MPIDLKGKKYYQVAERLPKFAEMFPSYRILTEMSYIDDNRVVMRVRIVDENGQEMSSGHAEGKYTGGDKVLEKTESVACGRALAFLHPELMGSEIASADEIAVWVQHGNDEALLKHIATARENWESLVEIKGQLKIADDKITMGEDASEHFSYALEAWRELGDDVMRTLWRAPSKGGVFTTRERKLLDMAATEDHKQRKANVV